MAVKTPAITAKAHPLVMTIHPEPSAFERFNKTFATHPLPNSTRTSVPMNSPKQREAMKVLSSAHPINSSNHFVQSNDRLTANFHSRYISSLLLFSRLGSQVRSTAQFARRSFRSLK